MAEITKKLRRQALSSEEKLALKIHSRRRFKQIVRLVITNKWLTDVRSAEMQLLETETYGKKMKLEKGQGIPYGLKVILMKPFEDRTQEEMAVLERRLVHHKCFRKYAKAQRLFLVKVAQFHYFEAGRILLKQGHKPNGVYFLLRGDVELAQNKWNDRLKMDEVTILERCGSGDTIGLLGIVKNQARTVTATCKTNCELLYLSKEQFDDVLKGPVKEQWDTALNHLQSIEYFQHLADSDLSELCLRTEIQSYAPDQVVFGDGHGKFNHCYFILDGFCQVVEVIEVLRQTDCGNVFYKLVAVDDGPVLSPSTASFVSAASSGVSSSSASKETPDDDDDSLSIGGFISKQLKLHDGFHAIDDDESARLRRSKKPQPSKKKVTSWKRRMTLRASLFGSIKQKKIMQVCMLKAGNCFNIGENIVHRSIVAKTAVKTLAVPNYMMKIDARLENNLMLLKHFLDRRIPSRDELFGAFVRGEVWRKYRGELVKTLKVRETGTSLCDVPVSYRVENFV